VLHRSPFRETSLFIDLFTCSHGMLRLLAKGAHRGKATRASVLQPFLLLKVSWTGKTELPIFTGGEIVSGDHLAGGAMLCGLYVNELLIRLLPPMDPHPLLFNHYQQVVAQLGCEDNPEPILRRFELDLLNELGYAPVLNVDAESGNSVIPDGYYDYIPEHGPVECSYHGKAFRGKTLLALNQRQLIQEDEQKEAKRLMRSLINQVLGNRPLKSRELFRYTRFE
jgi:DNA repair protein RecO (recombination protein O)